MPRFRKTTIHWYTAGLLLFGLYALAGLVYAAISHSTESVAIWAAVAIFAFGASFVFQTYIKRRRGAQERQGPR